MSEEAFYEEMLQREAEDNYPLEEDTGLAEPCMLSADISLEDQLANIGVSFHDKLLISSAAVAQEVAHLIGSEEVTGSTPVSSFIKKT